MDNPELIIPIRFGIQGALQDLQTLNARTIQGTKQTQDSATKIAKDAERARTQAAKEAVALIAQANKDLTDKSKKSADERTRAEKAAAAQAADAWKASADEQHRTAMWLFRDQQQTAKEETRAEQAAAKERAQLAKETASLIVEVNKEAAAEAKRSTKEQSQAAQKAFADWKASADQQHQTAMWLWEEQQQAVKQEAAAEREAGKQRTQAAKEAATLIAQTHKDLATKISARAKEATAEAKRSAQEQARAAKDAADAQTQAVKDAADQQKQAAKDAFADWKAKADEQHRTAMWQWEDQQQGIKKTSGEARGFGDNLLALAKTYVGFHAFVGIASAIGQQFKEAADYTKELAKDFIDLRKSMQEVANLRGASNTSAFTLEEAQKAKAAGLTPQERRDFQSQFLNFSGSQVGNQPGAKLTEAQGEDFGNRVALMMKASGVDPKLGAELAGSMLEQAQGPQDVNQLMRGFSETSEILQKGRVPLGRAIPDLSRIMARGISAQDAAKMYAIVSPAASGEESTSVDAALRAVQEMKNQGTGETYGVKQGMSDYESVKAFATNINQRQQTMMGRGMTEKQASDAVQKELADQKIAADSREARGLVRGFGGQGIRLGGFERFEAVQAGVLPNYEANKRSQYLASEAGQQDMRQADTELAKAERGKMGTRIQEIRQEAETELIRQGRFEKPEALDLVRRATERIGGDSFREQLISEKALQMTQDRTGIMTLDPIAEAMGGKDIAFGTARTEVNRKIEALLERQVQLMEEARANNGGKPALSAPPPAMGGGARMGGG